MLNWEILSESEIRVVTTSGRIDFQLFFIIITIIIIDELVLILLNSFHPQSRHRLPLALRRIEIPKMNTRLCHRDLIRYPRFGIPKTRGTRQAVTVVCS